MMTLSEGEELRGLPLTSPKFQENLKTLTVMLSERIT